MIARAETVQTTTVISGFVGFVRKIGRGVRAVSGGDGTFAAQSFKFLSSRHARRSHAHVVSSMWRGSRFQLDVCPLIIPKNEEFDSAVTVIDCARRDIVAVLAVHDAQ